ncbi:hypothetical protein GCM10027318_37830 [Massilia agilis]
MAACDGRAQLGIVGLVGGLREAGQGARQQAGGQDEPFHCVVSRIDGSGAMPCRPAIIDYVLLVVKLIFVGICRQYAREHIWENFDQIRPAKRAVRGDSTILAP